MSTDGSGPYEFYKYWLGELVLSFIVPIFAATELAWIGDIFYEKDTEDFAYSLIEPILIAFFYPFLAFPTAYAIKCDYKKAIDYYDPEFLQAYLEFKQKEAEKAAAA